MGCDHMKIEKISDTQIRCTLDHEDLVSREIKLSELAYGTEKAKLLFHDMIEQASHQFGFEANDIPLMIEAVPISADCLVLIITKVEDPEELDTRFSQFAPGADDDYDDELTDLDIEDNDGYSIDLYEDEDHDNEVDDDLEEGETYYAKSSTNKITIDNSDVDSDYVRLIYGSNVYELGDTIKLSSGINTIKVRVYDDEYDEDESYSSADYSQYTLKINYDNDSDEDDSSDDVDLNSLSLSSGNLTFNKNVSSYNITVNPNVSSINVEAIPSDSDYTVKINNTEVSESDYYSKNINLTGNTTIITVTVSNDDEYKTYTINLNKAVNDSVSSDSTNSYIQTNSPSGNTFIGQGESVSQSKTQNINTGWYFNNNSWYYNYSDGTKATGWILTGGNWYYLNSDGKMLTGWFLDSDGRWYYLYDSGAMAYNTTINGYKLGQNGAWIN